MNIENMPEVPTTDYEQMWDNLREALLNMAKEKPTAQVNCMEMVGVMRVIEARQAVESGAQMREWMASL